MKILMAEYRPWQHRVEDGEHKYARFFLQDGHQVFWLTHFLDLSRIMRQREDDLAFLRLWRRGIESPEPGLQTFTPFSVVPYVPFPGLDNLWAAKTCQRYTVPGVKRTLTAYGFAHVDVLWIGNPRLYSLLDLVTFDVLAYRMSDDMDKFPTGPRSIGQVEAEICRRADVVFATARPLVRKAQQLARKVCYLPNGSDFRLFNSPSLKIPTDLADIPEPRMAFVGVIGDWFDFESLEFASQALPNCNFVIIGPGEGGNRVRAGIEKLRDRNNVYVLGSRPFAQVPCYLAHSQVGLIPFIRSQLTESINPIKLFEYSAAGLPIVSRDLQEVRNLESPALVYSCPETFVACIRKALRNRQALHVAGVEFGRANSWARRYEMVKDQLSALNLKKNSNITDR